MASPSSNSEEEEEVLLLLQKCTEEVTLELKHADSGDSSGGGGISNLQSRLEALKKCSSSAACASVSTLSSVVPTAQATGESGVGVALTLEERLLRLKMKNDDHNAHDGNNILDDDVRADVLVADLLAEAEQEHLDNEEDSDEQLQDDEDVLGLAVATTAAALDSTTKKRFGFF
eukprot:CAMPEP_0198711134 /NCGR_PEP_ID=MMETSP1471-20131121/3294_1 /TAXON_ID=41880 /ORGANISM="Pycnococcus provasolii, Strain RCC733" /LENGTH=173 /DNA_ID=CAMNT_0044470911 /DNA_START=106 /DNA_END=627 /DNA_ORIENTATION=+